MKFVNQQEKDVLNSFLEDTFYKDWKNNNKDYNGFYTHLELQINSKCDLGCKYCYYSKFGNKLYSNKIAKNKDILNNLKIYLKFLEKNKMFPFFEPFSGEIFSQEIGFEVVNELIDFYKRNDITFGKIIIPTNFNFILSEERTKKVKDLIEKGRENSVEVFLSCSIDGKYVDENRPFLNGYIRNDDFYNKVFQFCKDFNIHFHPMIYFDKIEKWIDNFNWFQKMFEKFDLPWDSIYLLEVRNKGWNIENLKHFYNLFYYITKFIINKHKDNFSNIILKRKNLNIFSMFHDISRGMPCSIQTTLHLRLGDLSVNSCHRLSYDHLNGFKYKIENKEIVDIELLNHVFYLSTFSTNIKNLPICSSCFLKNVCLGGCLGSQYEINKDPFVPIESVCMLEHTRFKAIIDCLNDNNLISEILINNNINNKQKETILEYLKFGGNNGF